MSTTTALEPKANTAYKREEDSDNWARPDKKIICVSEVDTKNPAYDYTNELYNDFQRRHNILLSYYNEINSELGKSNALFIYFCRVFGDIYPYMKYYQSKDDIYTGTSPLDQMLINKFYLIPNTNITTIICTHDLDFLKKNSNEPYHMLPLLIMALLVLHYTPNIKLNEELPNYLHRIRNMTRKVLLLLKEKKLSYTNYYYLDIAKDLFCHLPISLY
ncbi:hypothetical protein K502DRAFT_322769 [Neoconidiobolus thromboides FSU 785]|nr:hypothetical protein K502DRAFT_322769 [Neoconidiobolus thromboides FSU 785]